MDINLFQHSPIGRLQHITGNDTRFDVTYDHYAFVPEDLPEEIPLNNATWTSIIEAERAISRLEQASHQISSPDLFLRPTLRREAQSTSALEGTFAPLNEVLEEIPENQSLSKEMHEIVNYLRAAQYAFRVVGEGRSINISLLEDIHNILVDGTQSDGSEKGRIRDSQVIICDKGAPISAARFIPMPGGLDLKEKLKALMDWMETSKLSKFPVIASALVHYQFETLHPFNDGNGRIGRLLIILQLMRNGVISVPLLSVSPWFEFYKEEYKDHLRNLSITGDWNQWITFFATGLTASASDTRQKIDDLRKLQEQYVLTIQESGKIGVIREIAEQLISVPVFTASQLATRFNKSAPAINTALKHLVDLKILTASETTYARKYTAPEVISILNKNYLTVKH